MSNFLSRTFLLAMGLAALAATTARAADDAPTIIKSWVNVTAYTANSYQKDYKTWSWLPQIKFRVNGPLASGDQLWCDFALPSGPWVKFDCKTGQIAKDHWWKTEGGGRDIGEDKGSTYTGPVTFAIHLRNELAGTNSTLFTGKFTVANVHSNENPASTKDHMVYYVDQDWNLPIAYVYTTKDDLQGMKLPALHVAFWARGDAIGYEPHLFYQGKEVGKIFLDTMEMGKAGYDPDIQDETTQLSDDSLPQKAKWSRVVLSFPNVKAWDKTGKPANILPGQKGAVHLLADNPGEYEVKVLQKGHLARDIKFTVNADGKFDTTLAAENKMGDTRAIVPVQILGDNDGTWNKDAWKTDAFYGNPLTGFTPAP